MTAIAATALGAADRPHPELAGDVVREALDRAGSQMARGVLLFLSGEFAHHAQRAVTAASRAANCLQVVGCTATGVFTEEDWILDRPAAAAMVINGAASLADAGASGVPVLSLCRAELATPSWLEAAGERFGVLSTGNTVQDSGRVWCHGKVAEDGRCEAILAGTRAAVAVSRGLIVLGEARPVTVARGYDLIGLDGESPLGSLRSAAASHIAGDDPLPLHRFLAAVVRGEPEHAIDQGRFDTVPLISAGGDDGTVTLGAPVAAGARLCWMMREPEAAMRDSESALDDAIDRLGAAPDFAVMFSCMGRGPYFFGHTDRDLECLVRRLPGVPLVGAYGCGEIATAAGRPQLLHNSAVMALFRRAI